MKTRISLLVWLLILCSGLLFAQDDSMPGYSSVGHRFDMVFDRLGNKYTIGELQIPTDTPSIHLMSGHAPGGSRAGSCGPSYFTLWYEPGGGFDDLNPTEIARKAVLEQVFCDLSAFINSPCPAGGINIWVRNIASIPGVPPSAAGVASGFYGIPSTSINPAGTIDNLVWQTLHTGTDAYTGLVPILIPSFPYNTNGVAFFHGMVAFNFSTPFNTSLSSLPTSGSDYDFYAVALHEAIHILGFNSLIDQSTNSVFSSVGQYYSRYDSYLTNTDNSKHLITNDATCTMYGTAFNTALTAAAIEPNAGNLGSCNNPLTLTDCSNAVRFWDGTLNQPVFTPDCWQGGSSLSHFEDACTGTTSTPANNDLYFVMSNRSVASTTLNKRWPTPEERSAICDIGYSTNTTFGNAANLNYHNYGGSVCPGITVAGVNDGIVAGAYAFHAVVGSPIALVGANLLGNDYGATNFRCLEEVYGTHTGALTTTGNAATPFSYTPTSPGVHVLRYVPYNSANLGISGNITYVILYADDPNCIASPCDYLLTNGGFDGINCGQLDACIAEYPGCWSAYVNSPDAYQRGCVINGSCGANPANELNTIGTWDEPNPANSGAIAIGSGDFPWYEGFQGKTVAPLIQGQSYQLDLQVLASAIRVSSATANTPGYVRIYGSATPPAYLGSVTGNAFTAGLTLLANIDPIPRDAAWHHFSPNITIPSGADLNYVIIVNGAYDNPYFLGGGTGMTNVLVDEVHIYPINTLATFNLPATSCTTSAPIKLNLPAIVNPLVPGSTFSGPGVYMSGSDYFFNPAMAGVGIHSITYTYTNAVGCQLFVADEIEVKDSCCNIQAHFTIEKDTLCTTDSIMITFGGGPYRRFLYPFPPYYSGIKPVLPPAGETKHEGVPPELAPGGTYTICCVIYSANPDSSAVWCSDTACIDITVINCCDSLRPVFDFIPAKDTLCVGDTIIIRLGGHGYGKWIDYQDGGSDPAYPISGNIYDTIVLGPEAVGGHDVCFVLYSANPDSTDVFCSDTICHHKEIIVCSCDSLVGKSKLAYNVPKDMLYDFYNAGGLQPSFIKWFIDGTEAGETTGDGHFPYLLQPGAHVICMRAAYVFPGENGHSLCCYDEVCDTLSVDSCEFWRATDYINYQRDPSNYHNVTFTYTGFTGDANYDLTMIWNFGDGSETVTNGLSPVSHTYPNDGFYNPCITLIWSRYGAVFNPDTPGVCCCVDTICLNLQIDPCNGNAFIIKEAAGPATTFMAVPVSPVTAIWYYWTANGVSSPMGLMPLFTYPVGFEDTICVTITYSFVNADGTKDTCKTQVCQVFSSGTPPAGLLRFFPNPANNFLAVEVMASVGEMSTIEITDYMGRPMITQRFENLTQGLNSLYLGIYDLPKGLYAMKVKVGSESKVVKFVKE